MTDPDTLALVSADDLPTPPEIASDYERERAHADDGGEDDRDADIERARETHYEEPRPRSSGDPDDGPIDSDASFKAWERLDFVPRWLPVLRAF